MGAKGRLIIANHTVIEALPWLRTSTGYTGQIWMHKRKLKLSDPVSRDVARAHAEMVQEACCVVREKPRGPRGGRGAMHYNTQPTRFDDWWPKSWDNAAKGCLFFLVSEVVSTAFVEMQEERAKARVMGVGPGVEVGNAGIQMQSMTATQVSEMQQAWVGEMHTITKTRDEMAAQFPANGHQLDAYRQAMADSLNYVLGTLEIGQIDGMRYIEAAKIRPGDTIDIEGVDLHEDGRWTRYVK